MDVSNLSTEQKDQLLASLLQSNPELVQRTVGQITAAASPSTAPASTQQQQQNNNNNTASLPPSAAEASPLQANNAANSNTRNNSNNKRSFSSAAATPKSTSSPNKRRRNNNNNNNNTAETTSTAPPLAPPPPPRIPDYSLQHLAKNELWQARLQQLTVFFHAHGHTRVPVGSRDYPYLGRWVDNQRQAYRVYQAGGNSWLTAERIQALDEIHFCWSVKAPGIDLETRLAQMNAYRNQHGHLRIPMRDDCYDNLGRWMANQRKTAKDGTMSAARRAALERVEGFEWHSSDGTIKLQWDDYVQKLTQFKSQHGHTTVPCQYPADPELSKWVRRVRAWYHAKQRQQQASGEAQPSSSNHGACLTTERMGQLALLGFEFTEYKGKQVTWQERFDQICEFQQEHGHCRPGKLPGGKTRYLDLCRWIDKQMWLYNNRQQNKGPVSKHLPDDQFAKLDSIGFFQTTRKVDGAVWVNGKPAVGRNNGGGVGVLAGVAAAAAAAEALGDDSAGASGSKKKKKTKKKATTTTKKKTTTTRKKKASNKNENAAASTPEAATAADKTNKNASVASPPAKTAAMI